MTTGFLCQELEFSQNLNCIKHTVLLADVHIIVGSSEDYYYKETNSIYYYP